MHISSNKHRPSTIHDESTGRIPPQAIAAVLCLAPLFTLGQPAMAADATWSATPGSGDFNTAANWDTGSVPTGSTATFGASTTTSLTFSGTATVDGFTINSGTYDFTTNGHLLSFMGAGITINGGAASVSGPVYFYGSSSASTAAFDTTGAGITFWGSSTAADASISGSGAAGFRDISTAGNAIITAPVQFLDSSTAGASSITSTFILFSGLSTAGSATIIGSNFLEFNEASTAGSATITNNAAFMAFNSSSTAGDANITNNTNNHLQFKDTSSAAGSTIINNGTLDFFTASTAGAADITSNDLLRFRDGSSAGGSTITNNEDLQFQ